MLAPLFEAQRTAGKQMMESSVEMARKLCGIDKVRKPGLTGVARE